MWDVPDPYNLQRFADAQAGVYDDAVHELRRGRKETHWMWFVFPQLKALGRSRTAEFFGIGSIEEARAYLEHPVLGQRLRDCADLVGAAGGEHPIEWILGPVDAVKLRSSMTLFRAATDDNATFQAVLDRYYGGDPDPLTLEVLSRV